MTKSYNELTIYTSPREEKKAFRRDTYRRIDKKIGRKMQRMKKPFQKFREDENFKKTIFFI
jgi:hypothetical protein